MTKHPFHLVSPSPWPLLVSFSALLFVSGLIFAFSGSGSLLLKLGLALILTSASLWWSSIIFEATILGCHTLRVQSSLRIGIVLFIISEIMLFVCFFWAYLHCSLSPNVELGSLWPPIGIVPICPWYVPLLNTVILLVSGCLITWSLSLLKSSYIWESSCSLFGTILLGGAFQLLQIWEYYRSSYTISDSTFGCCFYLATGLHGLHVFFGFLFLLISLVRMVLNHFSASRHLGFEFACWYWHFVDFVWLLLFFVIYCWGG